MARGSKKSKKTYSSGSASYSKYGSSHSGSSYSSSSTRRTYSSSNANYRSYGSRYNTSTYQRSNIRRSYNSSTPYYRKQGVRYDISTSLLSSLGVERNYRPLTANYRKYGSKYSRSTSQFSGLGVKRRFTANQNNASKEVLTNSRFYVDIDGIYSDLVVKSISGLGSSLEATEDSNAHGASKYAMSFMQATVTGINANNITMTFMGSAEDSSLYNWYKWSHSSKFIGGMTLLGGTKKTATIVVYDQGGGEGARWNLDGLFPVSYKCSSFSADSNELYQETIEFSCERIKRVDDSWF
ncbi:MAG: phage tail protein [Cyanobacteria bacterium SBLK]|nr:phage tail protein [Cyanobacteria bacterium SBLK]